MTDKKRSGITKEECQAVDRLAKQLYERALLNKDEYERSAKTCSGPTSELIVLAKQK